MPKQAVGLLVFARQTLIKGKVYFMCRINILFCYPRHLILKRSKIVGKSLRYQSRSVGKEKNAFFKTGFPKTPNNLKSSISFSRACCHNEQDSVLTVCNSFNGFIDCVHLIIARLLVGIIRIIGLINNRILHRADMVLFVIHLP